MSITTTQILLNHFTSLQIASDIVEVQDCQHISDANNLDDPYPITFICGKVLDSQCNYTALVIETFGIYMSIKRLNFCLQNAEFTFPCDHKPLEKFVRGKKAIKSTIGQLDSYSLG